MRKIFTLLKQGQKLPPIGSTNMQGFLLNISSQVVLLLKMPCDGTSWTGTQVANHS